MEPDFSWMYLIFFLMIPLARIIPRIFRKMKDGNPSQVIEENRFRPTFDKQPETYEKEFSKPLTKNMLVLGEMNKGARTFEAIQKNTGLNGKELDTILENLEKNNMIKVRQKQGLLGPKIEIYLTDQGFKEYHS